MKVNRFTRLFALLFAFSIACSAHAELEGFFPAEGGRITVQPTGGPVEVSGIELVPTAGSLTQGESAAPFTFFLPNSAAPGNVTLGNLGSSVTFDGPITLDVVASADAIISATYGSGIIPVEFPVTGGGGGSSLAASFAYDGGPITVEPRFGNPYNARSLSFDAISGTLTGGGSPAPFESLVGNTPQNWSVNSTTDVLIDGPVVLDVAASRGAIVDATSNDGTNSNQFRVTRIDPAPTDLLTGSFAFGGGPITICLLYTSDAADE